MSKSKKSINVSFGHNAENVTGSYTLIDCGQSGKKILVDFGLIQENLSPLKEYQANSKRPDFKVKELTYVFATHGHIDHIGRIPMLYKWGCEVPLILPYGSMSLYKEMELDSARILEKDSLDLTKRFKKEYSPLFLVDDVYRSLEYVQEYPVGKKIQLDEDITFQFNYTGHILKACSITFWIKNGSQTRKICITGDLGNISVPQKFCENFITPESCNLLVSECTYGDGKRTSGMKQREKDLEKLKAGIITTCIDNKGSVLIPVFAYGRSPTILSFLYDLFYEDSINGNFDIPIIYASPLGTKLLKIYEYELEGEQQQELEQVLNWKNLKILNNFEELEAELNNLKPKILCLPSGMMAAGYSVFAASKILPSSKNLIMLCGYSAEGTLAWKIKQKKTKTINIDGKPIPARCNVMNLTSFSSHMQYPDLLDTLSGKEGQAYDKIALVHGNQKSKITFAEALREECSKRNKNSKIIAVTKGTVIHI